ncbi:hypothetical protein [Aeromonas aquatica]|uniref:hypothetical protein n=1 Tax=Aeromonas aquatica TaxID=558964 RepID=UPI00286F991E|nr:hypothetical protein [Aeromonas aquatica]
MKVVMVMAEYHLNRGFDWVLQSPSHFGEIVVDTKIGLCYFATNWYSSAMWLESL